MPEPSFLSDGETPRRPDTRWFRWLRILGHYQNQAGANPLWNPMRTDTLRELKHKVLKAIRGD